MQVWETFIETCYVVWLVGDISATHWEALGSFMDDKSARFHIAFLRGCNATDATPTLRDIVCHYGDVMRKHGPLLPFWREGVEAKHQPLKRIGKHRTNRKGFNAHTTDITQTMRRDLVTYEVMASFQAGKGTRKASNKSLDNAISRQINEVHCDLFNKLGIDVEI